MKTKSQPHFPPPTFESVPGDGSPNGKMRVTRPNAETGEILVRGAVPIEEYRGDGQAPERPERLPLEPQPPVGSVGWICAKWPDYLLARRAYKAALRRGALPPDEFDRAEEAYWSFFADRLTQQERSDLRNGRTTGVLRPVEPTWKKGDVLHLGGKQSVRVDSFTRTLKGWRTELVFEDFRSFFMKRTVGGSSMPKTDDQGYAADPTPEEKERARLDGAYTQTEEQAVPDGGEVLEDKLHRRLHEEQSMKTAMAQSKGRVRASRFQIEQRLNDARKKHQRATVKVLERKLKAAKEHEKKAA